MGAAANAGCCPTGTATTPSRHAEAGWSSTATGRFFTTWKPPDSKGGAGAALCGGPARLLAQQPDCHDDSQGDAIPGKALVGVVGHEPQHGPHHHQRAQESGDEPYRDGRQVLL